MTLKRSIIRQRFGFVLGKNKSFLRCLMYQLLDSFGGGSRGVVVSDEQHLLEVFVSWRVGLGRPGHVLTLKSLKRRAVEHHGTFTSKKRSKQDTVVIYQLQQEAAEVGPHSVRLRSVSVRKVNHVQEQALVDVKVLKVKNFLVGHRCFVLVS